MIGDMGVNGDLGYTEAIPTTTSAKGKEKEKIKKAKVREVDLGFVPGTESSSSNGDRKRVSRLPRDTDDYIPPEASGPGKKLKDVTNSPRRRAMDVLLASSGQSLSCTINAVVIPSIAVDLLQIMKESNK